MSTTFRVVPQPTKLPPPATPVFTSFLLSYVFGLAKNQEHYWDCLNFLSYIQPRFFRRWGILVPWSNSILSALEIHGGLTLVKTISGLLCRSGGNTENQIHGVLPAPNQGFHLF